MQPSDRSCSYVFPVDKYRSFIWFVKPAQQPRDRCFSGPGFTYYRRFFTTFYLKAEMFQYALASFITERYIPELDIPDHALPVFIFRIKCVSILQRDLLRIFYIRLFCKEFCYPSDVHLHFYERDKRFYYNFYRVNDTYRIRYEHRQRSDFHHTLFCQHPAFPQHDAERCRRHQRYEGNVQS